MEEEQVDEIIIRSKNRKEEEQKNIEKDLVGANRRKKKEKSQPSKKTERDGRKNKI